MSQNTWTSTLKVKKSGKSRENGNIYGGSKIVPNPRKSTGTIGKGKTFPCFKNRISLREQNEMRFFAVLRKGFLNNPSAEDNIFIV